MSRRLPVSPIPGEIVARKARAKATVRAVFDRPDIQPGQVVYARRSPFLQSAHTYWLEEEDGTVLSIIAPERFDRDFDLIAGNHQDHAR